MKKKAEKKTSIPRKAGKKKGPPKKSSSRKKAAKRAPKKKVSTKSARATRKTTTKKAAAGKAKTKKKASSVNKRKSASSDSAKKKTRAQAASKPAGSAKKKSAKKESAAPKAASKKKAAGTGNAGRKKAPETGAESTAKAKSPASAKSTATRTPAKPRPIAFSLEEAREVARSRPLTSKDSPKKTGATAASARKTVDPKDEPMPKARVLGAASLADILGRNPKTTKSPIDLEKKAVPKKFMRYFNLLIELREHVISELDLHTKDTLKRSSKEDSGNLSSYGQHIADAGTDSFDRDFALSLVSTEQEALAEVEAAIDRIHKGTYGVCEITGKPISRERLLAVPFARYSVEGQAEFEKTLKRPAQRGGAYLDSSDNDAEFFTDSSDD